MQELEPGLIIIHGNHLEELRSLSVQWMRRYPLRPLENEVLLVQSNGIAQWLKLALAEREGCGIAAALDVDLPARFCGKPIGLYWAKTRFLSSRRWTRLL